MADQEAKKSNKRRVRNPETFRERATKAAEEPAKVSRGTKLRQAATKASEPVKPAGRAAARISNRPPFRWLKKPLRIIGRILVPVYLRNSWRELRKVNWPTRRQSFRLTFAVLVFAAIFGAVVAGVDFVLDKIFRNLVLK